MALEYKSDLTTNVFVLQTQESMSVTYVVS